MTRTTRPVRLGFEALEAREVAASLAGRVFLDFDNSGAANGPDSGVSGVTLTLSGGGLTTPRTAMTDAQGNYSFADLPAGTYTLTQTQPTSPANQSGKVTAGSAGGTAAAASNSVSNVVLQANTSATGYLFAEVPLIGTGGTVYEDTNNNGIKDAGEAGIPNVTVTLSGTSVVGGVITPKTAATDANGNYTFTGLTPGTYMLVETQPAGYSDGKETNGTPAAATVDDNRFLTIDLTKSAAVSGGFNFGELKGGILSGVVFKDVNNDGTQAVTGEPGIPGVKVRLTGTDSTGQAVDRTATTGADGSYRFENLKAGTYSVQETQPAGYADGKQKAGTLGGSTTTAGRITGIAFTAGATASGYTFGELAQADLVLKQVPNRTTVEPGGTVVITYTLKNTGTAPATAAAVDVKPGGLTFVSASSTTEYSNSTKKWTVGDLAPGATKTIRLTFRALTAGTFGPTAKATTTAAELSTKNGTGSTITAGTVSAPSAPSAPSGPSGLPAWFRQLNPLTQMWLMKRFFG